MTLVSFPFKEGKPPGFSHRTAIQVRFKDVDVLGHVNHANHLTYFEIARMNYFNEVVTDSNDWKKTGFILARMEVDYLQPVLLNDEVAVWTRCIGTGKKSFRLEYILATGKGSLLKAAAQAVSVLVCYDYESGASTELLPDWVEKMKKFDGLSA